MPLRGANSPLLHCGSTTRLRVHQVLPPSEGRIRPSYIAASESQTVSPPPTALRGANSPLLHCGPLSVEPRLLGVIAPRGEFAPPTLRLGAQPHRPPPPSTPRGEFAPPTLRPGFMRAGICPMPSGSEGRIRPSYIAAWAERADGGCRQRLRGANSPLLHCGLRRVPPRGGVHPLRGANSPLLHCGENPIGRGR